MQKCLHSLSAARCATVSVLGREHVLLTNLVQQTGQLRKRLICLETAQKKSLAEWVKELKDSSYRLEDAEEELFDARQTFDREKQRMEKRARREESAGLEGAASKVEAAKERVRQKRHDLQKLQREQARRVAEMLKLRANHFPEVQVLFPECLPSELVSQELEPAVAGMFAVGRVLESYDDREPISTGGYDSRHDVYKATFEDQVQRLKLHPSYS